MLDQSVMIEHIRWVDIFPSILDLKIKLKVKHVIMWTNLVLRDWLIELLSIDSKIERFLRWVS